MNSPMAAHRGGPESPTGTSTTASFSGRSLRRLERSSRLVFLTRCPPASRAPVVTDQMIDQRAIGMHAEGKLLSSTSVCCYPATSSKSRFVCFPLWRLNVALSPRRRNATAATNAAAATALPAVDGQVQVQVRWDDDNDDDE